MAPTVTETSVVLDQSVFDCRKSHVAAKANYPKCAPEFIVDIQVDLPPERPGQSAPAAVPAIFVDDTQERPHPTTCQSSDLDSRRPKRRSERCRNGNSWGEVALIRLFVRPSTLPIVGSYTQKMIPYTQKMIGAYRAFSAQSAGADVVAEVRADEVGRGP